MIDPVKSILTYGPLSRSQFWGGRKPECPEETLEVRLRLKLNPHTTFVVEVKGVIDVHYASLTSQGVQHRVFYLDGHPSRYQPCPTELNFGEQTGTCVFPLVIAAPPGMLYLEWYSCNQVALLAFTCGNRTVVKTCKPGLSCSKHG